MKKAIALFICVILMGCGSITYPEGYDKATYEDTQKVIEIMTDYEVGKSDKDSTESDLIDIYNHLDRIKSNNRNWKKEVVKTKIIEYIYEIGKDGNSEKIVNKIREDVR